MMRDSSAVERLAHNQKVGSAILPPATNAIIQQDLVREQTCSRVIRHPTRRRTTVHSPGGASGNRPKPITLSRGGAV